MYSTINEVLIFLYNLRSILTLHFFGLIFNVYNLTYYFCFIHWLCLAAGVNSPPAVFLYNKKEVRNKSDPFLEVG